ncbi:MAG: ATP-binding protein [Candidatus Pacebacteria bacterium]|jgi:DNA replication protein DnaC|nr:ATP-binding protein [Candidatus Paceibacterota bacterium]
MSKVCEVCGKVYLPTEEQQSCPFCRREREWEKLKSMSPNFIFNAFPRGFQKTLLKYYHKDTKNYQAVTKLVQKMYNEEDNCYQSLFLYGDTGEGKTTFACALVEEILRLMFINGEGYFEYKPLYTLYDFFCALKKTYTTFNSFSETEQSILTKLENVPVLIVDDLGIEKGTEWEMYMLYGLVNNRSRELRTTIYTSNYSLEQLAEKIQNDRIVSRIMTTSIVMKHTRKY